MANLDHLEWLSKLSRKELYGLLEKSLDELKPIESLQKEAEENRQEAQNILQKEEMAMKNVKELRKSLFIVYFMLFIFFPFWILLHRSLSKKLKKIEENINPQMNDILDVAKQCESNAQEKRKHVEFLPFIPEGYCYTLAIETMLQIIENGRANTWQEVADRYEEKCREWKDDENKREMLELQIQEAQKTEEILKQTRRAANWAAIGAIGSWTSAAGIWRINSKL